MYTVSAQVNDVAVVKVPLSTLDFSLQPTPIIDALQRDPCIKLVYVTSPGNPTANLISKPALETLLSTSWNGIVIVDEAYIDFAPDDASLAGWVLEWPNLVVLQTLSKAFGLAGIRLGIAYASEGVARLLNNLKAPYNISTPTSTLARAALQPENLQVMRKYRALIQTQRSRLLEELPKVPGIGRFLGGRESNFLLVEMLGPHGKPDNRTALKVYEQLAEDRGVVVRFRGKELGCEGCLRITVGTEAEVTRFLGEIRDVLSKVHDELRREDEMTMPGGEKQTLEEQEADANDVVA
jgi:histidinol-phosphate aminotransferase